MESPDREYVIVPWGDDGTETEAITLELPSREITVQIEVPTEVIRTTAEISEQHNLPLETALAERLEINRARISLLAARSTRDVSRTKHHLSAAKNYLSGVETLDTSSVETEIERIWMGTLDQ